MKRHASRLAILGKNRATWLSWLNGEKHCLQPHMKNPQFHAKTLFTARYLYLYKTLFTHIRLYLVHSKTSLTTKHLHTKKTWGELGCSGRVGSSCSTSGTRQVTLVTNPVFTTTGTFPLSFVTQIFCNDWPIHGGDDKTF